MDAFQSTQAPAIPPFRCDDCDKTFSRLHELSRHLTEAKAHRSALPCLFPGCPKAYQRHSRTKEHFWDEHGPQLISLFEQDTSSLRLKVDIHTTQTQYSAGSPVSSEYLDSRFQQPLMPYNTNLPSNTTYAPYNVPHQQMQTSPLPQGQQGSYRASGYLDGISTISSLNHFISPTSFGLMARISAPQFPTTTGNPSSYYITPTMYEVGAPNFSPSMDSEISPPVMEGTYGFHETMDNVEDSKTAQSFADANATQSWGGS